MVKTIRKTIQITTRKRNNSVKINEEFYSYDKKNAQFEFLMDYDVPADKVIALFHFENSNRYYDTLCQFKGNLITIEFDTSLIVEDELVTGYLYFDKLDKSTDVYRFTFGVRLSEIDKTRELPVQEKVSRRIVPIEDIATKTDVREMLKSLRIENGTVDNDKIESLINSKVNDRLGWIGEQLLSHNSFQQNQGKTNNDIFRMIDEIKERFNNLSNIYLSSHQSLDHLASKDALDKIEQRVEQLEQNRGNDNHDFITRQALEDKHYLTSIPEEYAKKTDLYNDSELRNKITRLETNSVTKEKVEAVESRVLALENKPTVTPQEYNDSELRGRVAALETKQDNDTVYNDEEIKRRLTTLEGKTDNFITGVSVNKEGNNVTLTYNYVDGQSKNVSFTDSDTVNVAYDDSGLKQRITNLENRPQVEAYNDADIKQRLTALETNHVTKEELHEATELDETQFVSPAELEAKHYLTETQAESVYAKKSELYNDSALASRVSALESKQGNDTVYNDMEIKQRLTNLENRKQVDLTDYAKKSEIPNTTNFATTDSVNNLLRTQGEQATKISALENKSAYEIHGTGMPNGQVSAPIGTTYVDMNVTNGALKWIKHSGNGNTGWKVLIGDTGWRKLNSVSRLGNSFIKIRRVNNLVTYNFGGLQWGWFGIIRRNGPGFAKHNSTGERGAKVLHPGSIPEGFRSENSLIGGIYNDAGKPYGIWYLGGKSDSNYIQFSFNEPIPTDKDIWDIRVSAISYVTDEDWPTTLP